MTITTDLDTWWDELDSYNNSNSAKAKFQDIMSQIDQQLDELQQMNADGEFDKLPATVKAKFVWAWGQLDAVRDTLKADSDFMEALAWRP